MTECSVCQRASQSLAKFYPGCVLSPNVKKTRGDESIIPLAASRVFLSAFFKPFCCLGERSGIPCAANESGLNNISH